MSVYGKVHFVLHLLVKHSCCGSVPVVVNAGGIYVCEFLIESPFAHANLTDFRQQMLKIILANERSVLHSLLVYDIASERELADDVSTPLFPLYDHHRRASESQVLHR